MSGAARGGTLRWLRERYPASYTIGLERNPALRADLEQNCSEAHTVDLAAGVPDVGRPDLMLFLDVLEHLPDPLAVLRDLTAQLAPNGAVIVSLPNVAHLSVAAPLLFQGKFDYQDAGILDRTHLRFFVRHTAVDLLSRAGLTVRRGLFSGLRGPRTQVIDLLTLGALRTRLARQFILLAVPGSAEAQQRISWRSA